MGHTRTGTRTWSHTCMGAKLCNRARADTRRHAGRGSHAHGARVTDVHRHAPPRTLTRARAHHTPLPSLPGTSSEGLGQHPPRSVRFSWVWPCPAGADPRSPWSRGGADEPAARVTATTTRVGLSARPVRTARACRDSESPRTAPENYDSRKALRRRPGGPEVLGPVRGAGPQDGSEWWAGPVIGGGTLLPQRRGGAESTGLQLDLSC